MTAPVRLYAPPRFATPSPLTVDERQELPSSKVTQKRSSTPVTIPWPPVPKLSEAKEFELISTCSQEYTSPSRCESRAALACWTLITLGLQLTLRRSKINV